MKSKGKKPPKQFNLPRKVNIVKIVTHDSLDSKPLAGNLLTFCRNFYFNLDTRFDTRVSLSCLFLTTEFNESKPHRYIPHVNNLVYPTFYIILEQVPSTSPDPSEVPFSCEPATK
jgi:hypothetical protein